MEVDRIGNHPRVGTQQPGALRVEEIRVAAHFVYGPRRRVLLIDADIWTGVEPAVRAFDARAPNHVMEHVPAANSGSPSPTLRNIVHFPDLKGQDVPVFLEPNGHAFDLAPPVRRIRLD